MVALLFMILFKHQTSIEGNCPSMSMKAQRPPVEVGAGRKHRPQTHAPWAAEAVSVSSRRVRVKTGTVEKLRHRVAWSVSSFLLSATLTLFLFPLRHFRRLTDGGTSMHLHTLQQVWPLEGLGGPESSEVVGNVKAS